MISIDIISDTVCPWCFIGKRRLERAMEMRPDADYRIGWRPYQLNPELGPDGMARAQYLALKFGGPDRADQIYRHVRTAGETEAIGFRFDGIERQPNSFDSHRLIRWAAADRVQDAVVEALFQRYFIDGANIGERDILVEVAESCGMDGATVRDRLRAEADSDLVREEESIARRLGVNGVPCFIVDRKYAVSGAQDPSVLVNVFDLAIAERQNGAVSETDQAAEEAGDD